MKQQVYAQNFWGMQHHLGKSNERFKTTYAMENQYGRSVLEVAKLGSL